MAGCGPPVELVTTGEIVMDGFPGQSVVTIRSPNFLSRPKKSSIAVQSPRHRFQRLGERPPAISWMSSFRSALSAVQKNQVQGEQSHGIDWDGADSVTRRVVPKSHPADSLGADLCVHSAARKATRVQILLPRHDATRSRETDCYMKMPSMPMWLLEWWRLDLMWNEE